VLIIDDAEDNRDIYRYFPGARTEFDVEVAADGEAGVALPNAGPSNVIVIDLTMRRWTAGKSDAPAEGRRV